MASAAHGQITVASAAHGQLTVASLLMASSQWPLCPWPAHSGLFCPWSAHSGLFCPWPAHSDFFCPRPAHGCPPLSMVHEAEGPHIHTSNPCLLTQRMQFQVGGREQCFKNQQKFIMKLKKSKMMDTLVHGERLPLLGLQLCSLCEYE